MQSRPQTRYPPGPAASPPAEIHMLTTTLFVPLLLAAPQGPQFEAPVRMRAGDSPI
jgi:hypothetical protein